MKLMKKLKTKTKSGVMEKTNNENYDPNYSVRKIVKQQDLRDFQYRDVYSVPNVPTNYHNFFETGPLGFLDGASTPATPQFYNILQSTCPSQASAETMSFRTGMSTAGSSCAKTEKGYEYPDNPIFFVIRANEKRNIDIAQSCNKWVFSPQTEKKVLILSGQEKSVYLIFFVKELQMFMGIAEYKNMNIGRHFSKPTASIAWKHTAPLHKNKTKHLLNPYNFGKPIYESQDGDIVRKDVGEELMRIYAETEGMKT